MKGREPEEKTLHLSIGSVTVFFLAAPLKGLQTFFFAKDVFGKVTCDLKQLLAMNILLRIVFHVWEWKSVFPS